MDLIKLLLVFLITAVFIVNVNSRGQGRGRRRNPNRRRRPSSRYDTQEEPAVPNFIKKFTNRGLKPNCGFSDAEHETPWEQEMEGRIVGGGIAEPGTWPWLVAIARYSEDGYFRYNCAGALISSQFILTAAHCVHGRENEIGHVKLGDYNLFEEQDVDSEITGWVEKVISHPDYWKRTHEFDIALLKLEAPVQFTRYVHPICLPESEALKNSNFEGYYPFVAGWGTQSYRGDPSEYLMQTQIPIIPLEECQYRYRHRRNSVVNENNLCAGYRQGGRDACQGDSGGPLMLALENNQYAVIGVVSYGHKCALGKYPGIYTKVSNFLPWIREQMRIHG